MAPVFLSTIAGTRRRVLATTAVVSLALFAVHFIWAIYRPRDLSYWLLAVVGSAIAGCIGGGLTGTALWLYCRRALAAPPWRGVRRTRESLLRLKLWRHEYRHVTSLRSLVGFDTNKAE